MHVPKRPFNGCVRLPFVEREIDFAKHTEPELVEMFGRLDPRYAPGNCARLKELLIERGYDIRDGGIGPGTVVPSSAKLQELIGSPHMIECPVSFGHNEGLLKWLEPAHNEFDLVDTGSLQADGIHLRLTGQRGGGLLRLFGSLFQRQLQLQWRGIVDVESDGKLVHFAYRTEDSPNKSITLWFPDDTTAERLAAVLPKQRTAEFQPQLHANVEFERRLVAQSPQTPVTIGLVAINALVFLLIATSGNSLIAWGSNFGPYTTDGEWWRLFTSLFLHVGVLHLLFNLWALASFGPLVERLYGSMNYLLLYIVAGVTGSLASISWRPDVNSVGASGAILGILGALLAAQLRGRESFPGNIVRPLRNTTLVFLGWTLYSGFTSEGIDNAAHLGGLGAGFLMGLIMARPITGQHSYTRKDAQALLQVVPVAVLFLAGGLWCAQHATGSLVGEGLYWHTVHWLKGGEHTANAKFNAAVTLAKSDKDSLALAKRVESDVLPFWREASNRLSGIHLRSDSPNLSALEFLQEVCAGRVHGYGRFADGLRENDPQEVAAADLELKHAESLVKERRRKDQ